MEIHSGLFRPTSAFVAVPYEGQWYWIDDGDLESKRMLTLLMIFFSLSEGAGGTGAPIVTVPAGG